MKAAWGLFTLWLLAAPAVAAPFKPVLGAAAPKPVPALDTSSLQAGQLYRQAMVHLAAGERSSAEDLLRRGLEIDAADVKCRYALGTLLQLDGHADEARAEFQQGLALEPDHPRLLTNLGIVDLQLGRLDEADSSLQKAVSLSSNGPYACNALGVLRERQHRDDDAQAAFEQALKADPGFDEAHVNLGLLALSEHQSTVAEAQFRLAGPHQASALNGLGVLFWGQGRLDDAEHEFDAAVSADPSYEAARYNLALYLSTAARYEEAHYYLDPLQTSPHMGVAALTLEGAIERQLGHRALAIELLKRALSGDPGSEPAQALLGLVALESNDLELAEMHLSAAIELKPDDAVACNDLALVYQRKGMLTKAIEVLRKAVVAGPDSPDVQYNLGHLLDLDGQADEAVVHLQRYLELSPHAVDAADVDKRIEALKKHGK